MISARLDTILLLSCIPNGSQTLNHFTPNPGLFCNLLQLSACPLPPDIIHPCLYLYFVRVVRFALISLDLVVPGEVILLTGFLNVVRFQRQHLFLPPDSVSPHKPRISDPLCQFSPSVDTR